VSGNSHSAANGCIPGAEPSGEPGAAPPDETTPPANVFDDPYADPTAADLDEVPLPEGLDPEKNQAINRVAEREGLTRFVLEGRRVVAGHAGNTS
jgi:hypothetical protein